MRLSAAFKLTALTLLFAACSDRPRPGYLLNKPAPDFVVEKWLTPEPDRTDKFVLIDFWATWCPPCVANVPKMNELFAMFGHGLVMVGLSSEDEETVRRFAGRKIDYPLAIDRRNRMAHEMRLRSIPYVIIVDPQGIVRWEGNPGREPLTPEVISKITGLIAKTPPAPARSVQPEETEAGEEAPRPKTPLDYVTKWLLAAIGLAASIGVIFFIFDQLEIGRVLTLYLEPFRRGYAKRFGKPTTQDEWICRACGETNHKINRQCVECRTPRDA